MTTLLEELGISDERGMEVITEADRLKDRANNTFDALKSISKNKSLNDAEKVLCTYSYCFLLMKKILERECNYVIDNII